MHFWIKLFLILTLLLPIPTEVIAKPVQLEINAAGAILIDAKTGQVLYEKNSNKQLAPASTTKIMTAILAIESDRLDEKTTISKNAASVQGSTMHLQEGELISLRELVTGLMMRSGNDAAVAIAEFLSGSVDKFVVEMNKKAREIGAIHTKFQNPHGLPTKDHYSTAYDLAWIARYAMNNPTFAEVVSTRNTSIDWEDSAGNEHEQNLKNTNKLLWMLDEADGVKTGTTNEAGPCLVSSATKDDQRLIAVTLNDKNRWEDSQELLNWGFETFDLYEYPIEEELSNEINRIAVEYGIDTTVKLQTSEEPFVVIPKGKSDNLIAKTNVPKKINAPVYQGQKIGEVHFIMNDKTLRTIDLVAANNVEEKTLANFLLNYLTTIFKLFSSWGIV
ncbi:D-alanyl-D-alanine carboxypeptidase family protein [Anaerosinus gibii]|uniref:serine-type D-Ala-D-Ala carboxypeptidase n=1 Tax=Selenobaculum gibii TaxID=3054208 RepID=A0A9Y2AIX1_9FIRM|nr:D-alanyl-D-alanine carboxypeptidase family protein [Selenobaculum gbiensis]WIW70483.1 D-alanyl-D-alanine carboxypeptidase [Selenobaculum gbiensis]